MESYYKTKLGELFKGDCLEIMPNLKETVDMVLTDPPYGTTACKWDSVIPLKPMWERLKRLIKTNGAIVMASSQPFTSKLIASNLKMFKYSWVWDKKRGYGHLVCKYRPMQQTEDITVFGNSRINYYPRTKKRDKPIFCNENTGKRSEIMGGKISDGYIGNWINTIQPTNLISFSKEGNSITLHPTQKPVSLMEYLIKTYTKENEIILDFAAGSGTTGIACERLNRKWIMIEKEEKYCEIAKQRIKKETQQLKLFTASLEA